MAWTRVPFRFTDPLWGESTCYQYIMVNYTEVFFFVNSPSKLLIKQLSCVWFEMIWCPCDVTNGALQSDLCCTFTMPSPINLHPWHPRMVHYSDNERDGVSNHRGSIVHLTVCSGADQRKHQGSVSLAFVRGIHRWPVNSRTKGQ